MYKKTSWLLGNPPFFFKFFGKRDENDCSDALSWFPYTVIHDWGLECCPEDQPAPRLPSYPQNTDKPSDLPHFADFLHISTGRFFKTKVTWNEEITETTLPALHFLLLRANIFAPLDQCAKKTRKRQYLESFSGSKLRRSENLKYERKKRQFFLCKIHVMQQHWLFTQQSRALQKKPKKEHVLV